MTLENIEQLINPQLFQDQIKIEKEDGSFFYEKLKTMMLIRFTEEKLAYERENGNIGGQFIELDKRQLPWVFQTA